MRTRTLLAWAWTLLILMACLAPASWFPEPEGSNAGWSLFDLPHMDKAMHALMFAGYGFLWARAGAPDGRYWTLLVGGLLLALLIEVAQGVAPLGRAADPLDMLADTVGLAVGIAAYRIISPRPSRRPAEPATGSAVLNS